MAVTRISQSSLKQGLKKNKNFVAGIPPVLGRMYALSSVTVGATAVNSIEFTNIPQTYKHLKIVWVARSDYGSVSNVDIYAQFNGDTNSANYNSHRIYGVGDGTAGSNYFASNFGIAPIGIIPWASAAANCFGAGVTDILDYSNSSKNKVTKTFCGVDLNSNDAHGRLAICSSLWASTSPITSIFLYPYLSNIKFTQYSIISLYGVK